MEFIVKQTTVMFIPSGTNHRFHLVVGAKLLTSHSYAVEWVSGLPQK